MYKPDDYRAATGSRPGGTLENDRRLYGWAFNAYIVGERMLYTLSAKSFQHELAPDKGEPTRSLFDLPAYAHEELGLNGVNLHTNLLAGWSAKDIDHLRDCADKSSCPCLLLTESKPMPLASEDDDELKAALERMNTVVRVGNRLGCSAVALTIADAPDDDWTRDLVVTSIKRIVQQSERLEMNVLLQPAATPEVIGSTPDSVTGLIREIGGFRVGSFPDFQTAAATDDQSAYLKSIVPYASAVTAPILESSKQSNGANYNLKTCVQALQLVGFDGNLSIEWRPGNNVSADPTDFIISTRDALEQAFSEDSQE
ncbi:MAG: TIM barrel protein [Planctomycetota bacterium]